MNTLKLLLVILMMLFKLVCVGQRSDKVIIHTGNCNDLIAGIANYISIIAMQDSALSAKQISAYLITPYDYGQEKKPQELSIEKKYGKFKVQPDSLGVVAFHIKLKDTTVIETVRVKPLQAVCRLSSYKANSEAKIPVAEFKAQLGLIAYVECCGFDARCQMVQFEVLRVPTNELASKTINLGARFEASTRELIHQAQPGDLYIFRNIYYRCPGTESQRSEDMIFEIK